MAFPRGVIGKSLFGLETRTALMPGVAPRQNWSFRLKCKLPLTAPTRPPTIGRPRFRRSTRQRSGRLDELAGLEKDAGRKFGPTRRHTTRTARAKMIDARRRLAAHPRYFRVAQGRRSRLICLTAKRFTLFNVIEAVLTMRARRRSDTWEFVRLGFSVANVEDLATLLDNGQVEKLDFVFSVYFKCLEKANCERLISEFGPWPADGCPLAARENSRDRDDGRTRLRYRESPPIYARASRRAAHYF